MKNATKLFLIMVFVLILNVVTAFPQASSSTAELRGQVIDVSGAVIPGASITLKDVNKGISRTTSTDSDGNYIFLAILPNTYELKVEATGAGFAQKVIQIELTVGQQANVPVTLNATNVAEVVTIIGNSEVVELSRTQQSTVIDARQINSLPISRRNYLDYAQLTPGVSDSDNIADASDFRVAQTPQSGLSFGGNNGRGNFVSVDGAETNSFSGGVLTIVSQEAVQEFQVLRNSYNAEFGSATGGVINIISKSGSNSFHGSGFGLFRDGRFDARNRFDFSPNEKSPFNRQQYGGSFGGPIVRDKTFFFSAVERFDEKQTAFVNLISDPNIFKITPSQSALFNFLDQTPFAQLSAGLRAALTTTAARYPRTVKLFSDASGQFPFNSNETTFSTRIDHIFNEKDSGYARISLNDSVFENQAAGALTAVSRGRTVDTFNGSVLASETHIFTPNVINELKFQYIYSRFSVNPNDKLGPEINIQGFGNFGRDIFLPSQVFDRHYDVVDNISWVKGSHTFKFGGSFQVSDIVTYNDIFFGARFTFGANIPLSGLIAGNPSIGPGVLGQLTDFLSKNDPSLVTALNAPINALQAYNFNLPIVYQQGFGDAAISFTTAQYGVYGQDTWKVKPNLTLTYGLRYSLNDEPLFIPTDKNNLQPRVGFSWDPFSNGKTVIRGGAGIFVGTAVIPVAVGTSQLAGFGNPGEINIVIATATSNALGLPTSFNIYQTLLAQGVIGKRAITAADLRQFGVVPRPGAPLEVRFRIQPDYQNPTSYQASLGIERELVAGFSLEASYLFTRGLHITQYNDINQFKRTGPINPITGQPTFIRFPNPAQVAAGLTSDFRNPLRFQDNLARSTANSFYHAATISVQRRFSKDFTINAHYTYSKSIDESTDFNSDFAVQDPLNLRAERSLSPFDQRHRAVLSGVFVSPFKGDSLVAKLLGDWTVSPIFTAGSGRPFNLLLGFDANGDGRSQTDRPGAAGRNTGKGEPFYSLDTRLARSFKFKNDMSLEFTVEAFNLLNRTNFTGINNIVGVTPLKTFDVRGDKTKSPTQPLGFTSAAARRQLQFGVRFIF
ncbi:MAG: TonB-dependent receptor [Acidobacteriota bacterium]